MNDLTLLQDNTIKTRNGLIFDDSVMENDINAC